MALRLRLAVVLALELAEGLALIVLMMAFRPWALLSSSDQLVVLAM
jgi:hypothetical protein